MIIKKRPIITWLLNPETPGFQPGLTIIASQNIKNHEILNTDLERLKEIRAMRPKWGLPELVMPSFERVMEKVCPPLTKSCLTYLGNSANRMNAVFSYIGIMERLSMFW